MRPAGDVFRETARETLVAISNLDMHTKNLGLLHQASGEVSLAPAYDPVPMAHHGDADGKTALAVNKKYRHAEITRADLVAEMQTWGVRRPGQVVDATLGRLDEIVAHEQPLDGAHPRLQEAIVQFIRNLRG